MKLKLSILLIVLLTARVFAQEEIFPIPRRAYVNMGISFQMWQREKAGLPVDQLALPISILIPLGRNLDLSISHTPAFSKQYKNQTIYGLSDTWVQGDYVFWNDKAMLNLGVGLPTGKTRLDSSQFELSKQLSKNIYQFQLPIYGQGFSGMIGLAMAFPVVDGVVIGIGGEYLYRGSYYPVKYNYGGKSINRIFDKRYTPGDEASGNIGVDIRIGENMKIMLDGIYTYYWNDILDGEIVYRSGNKFTGNLGFFYRFNQKYIWTHLIFRQKGRNELLQGLYFGEEEKNSNGSQIEINVVSKIIDYQNGEIFALGEGRFYGKNQIGTGAVIAVGGGVGANYRFDRNTILDLQFKYILGQFRPPWKRSIEGLQTFAGLKFEL